MALKLNLNLKNVPPYAKILIAVAPAVIISAVVIFLLILPKQKEIKAVETKIAAQGKIAKNQAKAANCRNSPENEKLRNKLNELKKQLPEERRFHVAQTGFDLCIRQDSRCSSGSRRTEAPFKRHVYEIL
jgi:Tfp pilus assembly protein PilO